MDPIIQLGEYIALGAGTDGLWLVVRAMFFGNHPFAPPGHRGSEDDKRLKRIREPIARSPKPVGPQNAPKGCHFTWVGLV